MKKAILVVLLALATIFMATGTVVSIAYAQDAPPEVPLDWIYRIWSTVQVATPVAIAVASANIFIGYLTKTKPEDFRLDYCIYTAMISFIVGLATIALGWSYTQIQEWLGSGLLTWWLWRGAKVLATKITAKKLATQTSQSIASPGPPATTA